MEYESRVRSWTMNSYQWMGMTRRRRWEIERDMSKIRTQPVDALLYPRALLECSHRWYIPIHIRHLCLIWVSTGLVQLSRPNWGLNGMGRSRTITEWRIFLDGSDDQGWRRYYRPMIIRLFRNLYAYVLLAESLVWFGLALVCLLKKIWGQIWGQISCINSPCRFGVGIQLVGDKTQINPTKQWTTET